MNKKAGDITGFFMSTSDPNGLKCELTAPCSPFRPLALFAMRSRLYPKAGYINQ